MVSKSNPPASKKTSGRTARKAAPPSPPAKASPAPERSAKGLLRAGLKALNDVRDDVILRQSRVFDALLGIDTSHASNNRSARERKQLDAGDPGMQKFEEIFDQRVARSLERLGMPSPQALAVLCQQLQAINEHLKRVEPAPAKRPPRRRPARG